MLDCLLGDAPEQHRPQLRPAPRAFDPDRAGKAAATNLPSTLWAKHLPQERLGTPRREGASIFSTLGNRERPASARPPSAFGAASTRPRSATVVETRTSSARRDSENDVLRARAASSVLLPMHLRKARPITERNASVQAMWDPQRRGRHDARPKSRNPLTHGARHTTEPRPSEFVTTSQLNSSCVAAAAAARTLQMLQPGLRPPVADSVQPPAGLANDDAARHATRLRNISTPEGGFERRWRPERVGPGNAPMVQYRDPQDPQVFERAARVFGNSLRPEAPPQKGRQPWRAWASPSAHAVQ